MRAASYTQRSWWQLSNRGESSPFRETNYELQLFFGRATDYDFAGWTLRDVEVGFNHHPTAVVIRPRAAGTRTAKKITRTSPDIWATTA